MSKRKLTMYDAEWGDDPLPPKKKSLQLFSLKVNDELKRIEGKDYRRKKRKLDDIKDLENE